MLGYQLVESQSSESHHVQVTELVIICDILEKSSPEDIFSLLFLEREEGREEGREREASMQKRSIKWLPPFPHPDWGSYVLGPGT